MELGNEEGRRHGCSFTHIQRLTKGYSPRGHLRSLRSCTTPSVCHTALCTDNRGHAWQEAEAGSVPAWTTSACRDAPGTLPSSPRSRTRTSSVPGPHGQGRVSTVLPTHRVPSPRERLFQPTLSNLGLPKSGRRSPFCVVQCSAKVLHLN